MSISLLHRPLVVERDNTLNITDLPVDQVEDEECSANRQCDGNFDLRHRSLWWFTMWTSSLLRFRTEPATNLSQSIYIWTQSLRQDWSWMLGPMHWLPGPPYASFQIKGQWISRSILVSYVTDPPFSAPLWMYRTLSREKTFTKWPFRGVQKSIIGGYSTPKFRGENFRGWL